MKTKIVTLGEEFLEYEIKTIESLGADIFIYSYHYESYEGIGFAVWRRGGAWFYGGLGHCSCNGPTENLESANNAPFTLKQIKELEKDYGYEAKGVIGYIKKKKFK